LRLAIYEIELVVRRWFKTYGVAVVQKLKNSLQFVIAVTPASCYVQKQIQFCRRW
jgi:hypothetical protein